MVSMVRFHRISAAEWAFGAMIACAVVAPLIGKLSIDARRHDRDGAWVGTQITTRLGTVVEVVPRPGDVPGRCAVVPGQEARVVGRDPAFGMLLDVGAVPDGGAEVAGTLHLPTPCARGTLAFLADRATGGGWTVAPDGRPDGVGQDMAYGKAVSLETMIGMRMAARAAAIASDGRQW